MKKILNKKALSLAEVVVTLGIISSAMVVGVSVATKSLRLAKENEIRNTANEVLVQGLELIKSPSDLSISTRDGVESSELIGSYRFRQSKETSAIELEFVEDSIQEITSCHAGTVEFDNYSTNLEETDSEICYQIIFPRRDGELYSVVFLTVYRVGVEFESNRIESVRNGRFDINNQNKGETNSLENQGTTQ